MEFDNRYASNGKGNAGVALGVVGTVLGGLATLGNGVLGGWNGCGECSENSLVTRYELQQDKELTAVKTENALLKANIYNDQKDIEMYKYVDGKLREIDNRLCAQEVLNQKTADSFALVQQDIRMEAERRCCGDNSIINYANATFYPKMVADVTTDSGTTAQTLYNPIPKCGTGCCNGNN